MKIKSSKPYVACWKLYHSLLEKIQPITVPIQAYIYRKRQNKVVDVLKHKNKFKCIFLVLDDSIWKCDALFRSMMDSSNFDPLIVACAIPGGTGYTDMVGKMNQVYSSFKKKGFSVLKSFDPETNTSLDINSLKPDIVFYTKPFKSLHNPNYYVDKIKNCLTVYIPYYINGTNDYNLAYNLPVHNLCWKYYVESPLHLTLAKKYAYSKGKNAVVSGYPGIEDFINPDYKPIDSWKIQDKKIKRIIWAPHQSIEISGTVNYSTFLKYCDYMLQIAKKYRDSIQLAFKPHPSLKMRLYNKWGKEKTDRYYEEWASMQNTMISDSDYHDLFLTSDALIHDCGSFTIEYLYLNKPVMRLMNELDPKTMFGDFGMACINQHYLAYSEGDIDNFIVNVLDGNDSKYKERTKFVSTNLRITEKLPSMVILDDIIRSIKG